MWLLFLFLFIHTASAATIVSQVQSVAVLNGVQQLMTTVTVQFGPSDEGVPFVLDVTNPQSGTTDQLDFTHEAPQYVYTHQLTGWVPRAVYPFKNMVCQYDTIPADASLLSQPSVQLSSLSGSSNATTSSSFVQRSQLAKQPRKNSHMRVMPSQFQPKKRGLTATTAKKAGTDAKGLVDRAKTYRKAISRKTSLPRNVIRDSPIMDLPEMDGVASNAAAEAPAASAASVATGVTTRQLARAQGATLVTTAVFTMGVNAACAYGGANWLAGEGAVAATFGNMMCGSGGTGSLSSAISSLNTEVGTINKTVASLQNTVNEQQLWINNETVITNQLSTAVTDIGRQLNSIFFDISQQQGQINELWQETNSFINQTQNNFKEAASEISGLAGNEQALYNYTNALYNVTQQQFAQVVSQANLLDISLMQVIMEIYANEHNTDIRRALIANHWANIVNAPTELPSCLFAQCIGSPPLTESGPLVTFENSANCPADYPTCSELEKQVPTVNILNNVASPPAPQNLQDTHNLYSSAMLSMVRLQYTDSASNTAYERQLSYDCDKQFLLNNYIPGVTFNYLLRFLGPPYNGSMYCYNPASPGTDVWSCDCVIVQTFTSCQLQSGAPSFPFGWEQAPSFEQSLQIEDYCVNGTLQNSGLVSEAYGVTAALNSDGMVFSSMTNWNTFIAALCMSSVNWAVSSNGTRVRVTSDTTGGFVDMQLDPEDLASLCVSDLAVINSLTNNTSRLVYNIYSYFAAGYVIVSSANIGFWEQQIFGTMMTGSEYDYQEFNQRPDIQQTGACTTETVIKYAGTGIPLAVPYATTLGADPVSLNPYLVTNNDAYPPYPAFTELSNQIGNTNKLPVYSVAPIAQVYNPTLSVNGGECVVVNGSCSSPMNGLNFSTALEVLLTTEWQNLLPTDTYWVGDFNQDYNIDGNQVVIDTPSNLLPLSISRASVCNSLLYMMQPRNSVYQTDVLFNIPDTDYETDINAIDWASYYQTFFEPTCATESAYAYARVVDNQGICQQRVHDNGTLSSVIPGNNAVCTLMNAFEVYVPNYVSAFMYFKPRQYSVLATFSVPQGELVQNISTSCPTSYNVTMPNGANAPLYIEFFTTSTRTQTATFTLQGFGACASVYSSYTFTYSATLPYTTNPIAACGFQYGQVYPYLSNQPCFPPPGIEMYRAYDSNNGPITPSTTVTYVDNIASTNTQTLVQLMVELSIQSSLQSILPFTALSESALVTQYQQVLQSQISAITDANFSFSTASEQNIKTTAQAAFTNSSENVQKNLVSQEQGLKSFNNLTSVINASLQGLDFLQEQSSKANEQSAKQTTNMINVVNEETAKINQDLKRTGGGGGSVCDIVFIDLFCSLYNGLTGGIAGIAGIMTSLVVVIVVVAVAICLICICVKVLPLCMKSASSSNNTRSRSGQDHETNGLQTKGRMRSAVDAFDPETSEFEALRAAVSNHFDEE